MSRPPGKLLAPPSNGQVCTLFAADIAGFTAPSVTDDIRLYLHEELYKLLERAFDGNKRLGLPAVIASYGLNGRRLTLTNDQAYDLVMKVAAGELDQVEEIATILAGATAPRP